MKRTETREEIHDIVTDFFDTDYHGEILFATSALLASRTDRLSSWQVGGELGKIVPAKLKGIRVERANGDPDVWKFVDER